MEDSCKDDPSSTETLRVETTWQTPQGLFLAWTFQISGLSVVGTAVEAGLATEATKVDDGIAVGKQRASLRTRSCGGGLGFLEFVALDLNLIETAYVLAAAVVRCKFCNIPNEKHKKLRTHEV